jgi:hypothetical protein
MDCWMNRPVIIGITGIITLQEAKVIVNIEA